MFVWMLNYYHFRTVYIQTCSMATTSVEMGGRSYSANTYTGRDKNPVIYTIYNIRKAWSISSKIRQHPSIGN